MAAVQKCSDDFLKRLKFNKKEDESDEKENAVAPRKANESVGMDEASFYGSELPKRPIRRPRPAPPTPPSQRPKRAAVLKKSSGKAKNPAKATSHDVKKRPTPAVGRKRKQSTEPVSDLSEDGDDSEHDDDFVEERPRRVAIGQKRKVKLDWVSDGSEAEARSDESYSDEGDVKSSTGSSSSEPEAESSGDEYTGTGRKKAKKRVKAAKVRTNDKKGAAKKKSKAAQKKEEKKKEDKKQEEEPEEGSLDFFRLQSEKAKQEMLAMLNMDEDVADIKPPPPRAKPVRPKVKKEVVPVETRRSSRIRNLDAPDYSKERVLSDTSIAEAVAVEARNLDPVVLKDAAETPMDNYDEIIRNETAFLADAASPSSGADHFNLKEFVGRMKQLSMGEDQAMKVVPKRITTMDVHVSADPILIAAGDKSGSIGLWKIGENFDAFTFQVHQQNVSGLKFNPWQPRKLVTTGYDAVVRMLDLEKDVFEVVYGSGDDETHHSDMDSIDANSVLVSRGDGSVILVDLRQKSDKAAATYHCLDEPLKHVSVHPRIENYFAVGSRFGSGAFCDRRSVRNGSAASVAVSTFSVSRSVSSVAFNATGSHLSVVSYADTISVYETADFMSDNGRARELIKPRKVWQHNNQTGRWLTGLKCDWHPTREDCFLMGSLDTMRNIELWKADGTLLHRFTSPEEPLTICSVVKFHPSKDMVFGANSSGKIFYFE